ncbi:CHAT domain-containing protein [Algoriphagus sp. A40]|uniref:CHAT domain-containing protein n=1 Tax=Algoriphagus sp. A40 TaxID=1945863 RepID=UPI00098677D8|nr:CHAT domain-containing protein [Algoriphagus sp. A40]OOG72397.1 hypothetical protein B0E43_16030 [Algoriphagus sp. A40]
MKRILVFIFLFFLIQILSVTFSQDKNPKLRRANELYFLANPTEKDDREAIRLFGEVLNETPDKNEAPEFIQAAEHLGNLLLTYGNSSGAIQSYRQGIFWAHAYDYSDTLVYNHHLFLGEALFSQSEIDSSLSHLQEAERLQTQLNSLGEPERLYNALGVYFFETGNYIRSVSYFDKAQSYLSGERPEMELYAKYSFQSNKASALYHLGEYDSAQRIYNELLSFGINQDQIRINLANTYLQENEGEKALEILGQISINYQNGSLSFYNLKAKTQILSRFLDSALVTLNLGEKLIQEDSTQSRSFQEGIWKEVKGDYFRSLGQNENALSEYQKAIVQLLPGFENLDVTSNPTRFALGMSSLTVFEILRKKAETSWELYRENKDRAYFEIGLGAWESAFGLARFISVNFDNDKARVFLGEKVLGGYESAIDQLIGFAEKDEDETLIFKAFSWAELSKSEGLRIGALQESLKRKAGLPADLIQEEGNLLFEIFRNNQKQIGDVTPAVKAELTQEALDLEVQLSRLREKFRKYPGFGEDIEIGFDPKVLQKSLPDKAFLLSIFHSKSNLVVFGLENHSFSWSKIPTDSIPFVELNRWIQSITKEPMGNRFETDLAVAKFGASVFEKFEDQISDSRELIIVPQGIFNSLPFELLPFSDGQMLLEKTSVFYQFSAQFITSVKGIKKFNNPIGFAPFSESVAAGGFSILPRSNEELELVPGAKYFGKDATKKKFLAQAENADLVHLATHAVASSSDPNDAFIAFFPDDDDFRLSAPELAFQSLEGAKLIYLSACETGAGQLSRSEGFISLARSLAFAGAEQMVISQWVSEDRVAAYLAGKFYQNVGKGLTFSAALQEAKLELLQDESMAQYHHPFYWANFRMIGQPTEVNILSRWSYVVSFILIILAAGFWFGSKKWKRRMD